MSNKNYRRISQARRSEEREAWETEVADFAEAVDEHVKARRLSRRRDNRLVGWAPVQCNSKPFVME